MYKYYRDYDELQLDDKLALKYRYNNRTPFTFKGELFVPVAKDNYELVTKNFTQHELASRCEGQNWSFISMKLAKSLQVIRDEYESPIIVNSTFRNEDCNRGLSNAATQSYHQLAIAADWKFLNEADKKDFTTQVFENGCVYTLITNMGINAIIVYPNHFHIDTRENWIPPFRLGYDD